MLATLGLLAVVSTGCYVWGRIDGKHLEKAKYDIERAATDAALAVHELALVKLRTDYMAHDRDLTHEYTTRIEAANKRNAVLAGQLRKYFADQASGGAVREAPASAGGDEGAGGVGSGDSEADNSSPVIEQLNNIIAACQRDAIRLNWWIERESLFEKVEADSGFWLEVEPAPPVE